MSALTAGIIACAIGVHRTLGPGLLESAYEECLAFELSLRGLPVSYKGHALNCGYRIDFLVAREVVVEIKAVDALLARFRVVNPLATVALRRAGD